MANLTILSSRNYAPTPAQNDSIPSQSVTIAPAQITSVTQTINVTGSVGAIDLLPILSEATELQIKQVNRLEGQSLFKAILDSGVTRLRPILMTTIAMIAGMTPIALGIGAGSEVRSPMAIAVIGGLITSTLLTLIVVPVIFTYYGSSAKTRLWSAFIQYSVL